MEKLQPVRGTKDIFGEDYIRHEYIVSKAKKIADLYGYQGIFLPIFEFSNVFKRSLGETSDVVGKEMYSFLDKGNEELTLRPEFTASICRSYISNGFKQLLPLKLFTHGPLFRYERPQKGRQRQFHQVNFEYLGDASPEIDAETIAMAADFLEKVGVLKNTTLELNSLGCTETRKNYQTHLVEYLNDYAKNLSSDSQIRLSKNPLRILDSKDEGDKRIVKNAPKIHDYFTKEAEDFFLKLQENLKLLGITYKLNPNMVRGLDYYNHTAFEFITNDLGAQGTVLGGGRYNGLIQLLGGDNTEGIGFAAGIERLSLLCQLPQKISRPCAVLPLSLEQQNFAMQLTNDLRKKEINICFFPNTKFDKALKNAIKENAKFAIFIGEEELAQNQLKLKNLDTRMEEVIAIDDLLGKIQK